MVEITKSFAIGLLGGLIYFLMHYLIGITLASIQICYIVKKHYTFYWTEEVLSRTAADAP